ncbi:MAG: cytidine deaminase [Nocardioidaceae bacterium]|nr:cytidine deaminase [Nocardioidaceae bacterium]
MTIELTDPEDAKLLTLARASRARTQAVEGAAVRDTDGRTYTATNVDLPSLRLSALQVATVMAVSSGAQGLEACLVIGDGRGGVRDADVAAVTGFAGDGVVIYLASADGHVVASVTT